MDTSENTFQHFLYRVDQKKNLTNIDNSDEFYVFF